uniref:polynucleotide adenylyltransferase n=1 Tax=Meloidogyne floridensis TaxID=298350 RepID=A0A915NPI9_9BILA
MPSEEEIEGEVLKTYLYTEEYYKKQISSPIYLQTAKFCTELSLEFESNPNYENKKYFERMDIIKAQFSIELNTNLFVASCIQIELEGGDKSVKIKNQKEMHLNYLVNLFVKYEDNEMKQLMDKDNIETFDRLKNFVKNSRDNNNDIEEKTERKLMIKLEKKQKASEIIENKRKDYYNNIENFAKNVEILNSRKSKNSDLESRKNFFKEEKEWEDIANLKNEKNQMDYSTQIVNDRWLIPSYYSLSQDINLSNDEQVNNKLYTYLDAIYLINDKIRKRRNTAKMWIYNEVENWLKQTCLKNNKKFSGFSMVVGGSSLIGADSADSDLDIIFVIPIICLLNKEINDCELCKNSINKNQQLCTDHDLLYGDGINNESFTSHIWGVINDIRKEKVSSAYRINIIRGRVSSINIVYAGQNMDILFAVVPYEKIPDLIDLNNHENNEVIKNNLNLMDSLINDMIKINGIFYNQRRQIYSNMFGYLSGSILFVMAAKICLIYPFGELNFLLQKFFQIYSAWAWPLPLIIEDITNTDPVKNFNDFWDFNKLKLNEESSKSGDKMPILTSLFPEQNTAHNVN